MQIKVSQRGGDRNNHVVYRQAVEYFAKRLLKPSMLGKLAIKIVFAKNLHKQGTCGLHVNETQYNHVIRIDRHMPFHDIIATIAHEMVHVKQAINQELTSTAKHFIWRNKKHKINIYETTPAEDEPKIPWEVEAYKKEGKLAREFALHLFDGH